MVLRAATPFSFLIIAPYLLFFVVYHILGNKKTQGPAIDVKMNLILNNGI